MNIPPIKTRSSFNSLIEEDNLSSDKDIFYQKSSDLICDNFEINLIQNILKDNYNEEEETLEKYKNSENSIEENVDTIHNSSFQNIHYPNKSNIDFEKIDLAEINNEINKTKEAIKIKEQLFQQKLQEIQKMRETSEKVTLLKRKAIALYNELVLWSQNQIKTKYPHVKAQNQLPHSMDVYQNSSKDPDSISEQILIYFKDVKKQIKDKNE